MLLNPVVDYLEAVLDLGSWVAHRHQGLIIDNYIFFLHYRLSVVLFFAASLLVTTGLYIADPIECISDSSIRDVIDSYCWVHSTFTIPKRWNNSSNPLTPHPGVTSSSDNDNSPPPHFHYYYQWICYILVLQAMAFYIPHSLWKNYWEGGKVKLLVSLINNNKSLRNHDDDEQEKKRRKEEGQDFQRIRQYFKQNLGKHDGLYFHKLFFCEILNFIIVLGQMYCATITNLKFSDAFLYMRTNDPLERQDQIAQIFPKVTKCTFNTFGPSGNIVANDAMCVLPFNSVSEKIYLCMWLWLFILGSLSAILLIYRLLLLFFPAFRIMILKHCTKYTDVTKGFRGLRNKLSVGDWMLLRNISKNLDLLQFTDVVKSLQANDDDINI